MGKRSPSGPARAYLLAGRGERAEMGLRELLGKTGKVAAPIVIGRDHLDTGSVAALIGRPRP